MTSDKVRAHHLERKALLYVRLVAMTMEVHARLNPRGRNALQGLGGSSRSWFCAAIRWQSR